MVEEVSMGVDLVFEDFRVTRVKQHLLVLLFHIHVLLVTLDVGFIEL